MAVYKALGDVTLYVLGWHDDNELLLQSALDTIHDALDTLLRGHVNRRTLLEVRCCFVLFLSCLFGARLTATRRTTTFFCLCWTRRSTAAL